MSPNLYVVNDDAEPHERLINALQAVGGPLSEGDRHSIKTYIVGTLKIYQTREDIVVEGQRPVETAILVKGLCCRYKLLADGSRQIMSFHIPGDAPDVESLFLKRMDHSLGTLDGAVVLHVPHANMFRLFAEAPRVQELFWHWTLIEASIFREWIVNVGRREAYARIAHLLCETVTRLRAVGLSDGVSCDLPITQTELADATGLSAVHVNRSVQTLRKNGLISFRAGSLTALDWNGLVGAAGFDAAYLHISPEHFKHEAASGNA
jgi:CRP-like cAMP-binding protein